MASESASVFVWPAEVPPFNFKDCIELGPLSSRLESCVTTGSCAWFVSVRCFMNRRIIAFCLGHEFAEWLIFEASDPDEVLRLDQA